MTLVDHAEMKRLAERATPYWQAVDLACGGNPVAADLVAPFVGLMSPSVVLALLSEIEGLKSYAKDAANEALEYRRQLADLRTQAPDSWRPPEQEVENVLRCCDAMERSVERKGLPKSEADICVATDWLRKVCAALRPQTAESGK